jgi:hypothetical protein
MPDLASPEWAEEVGALWSLLPEAPGGEGTVSLAFGSAPRKEVAVHWRYDGGRPVGGGSGTGGDPQLSLTLGPADVGDVLSGTVPADVAFMRGRLKASGEGGLLLAFLASTTAPGFEEWRTRVAGVAGAG